MFSAFFINRPIFASVLSIIITLAGSVALFTLPIAQYPEITPPTVEVSASYPGANAQVVADTVAAPIEQQVIGVEDMLYMSSPVHQRRQLRADGDVQQRHRPEHGAGARAKPRRPGGADFARPGESRGVTVKKKSPSVLMIVNLFSPDGSRDNLYLSNYATIQLKDELSRLEGWATSPTSASAITACGCGSIRRRLAARNLTATDVVAAIEAAEHAGGRRANRPAAGEQWAGVPVHDHARWAV